MMWTRCVAIVGRPGSGSPRLEFFDSSEGNGVA